MKAQPSNLISSLDNSTLNLFRAFRVDGLQPGDALNRALPKRLMTLRLEFMVRHPGYHVRIRDLSGELAEVVACQGGSRSSRR